MSNHLDTDEQLHAALKGAARASLAQFDAASGRAVVSDKVAAGHSGPNVAVNRSGWLGGADALEKQRYSGGSMSRWLGYGIVTAIPIIFVAWQMSQPRHSIPISAPQEFTTYTTRAGQRASLTLSDGSRVTLGPATTLRVQKSVTQSNGTAVEVVGEALFNVAHAAQRPFAVTAHGVTTRVLGTEFVVRAYDASTVRIAVRDGRVSVQSPIFTSSSAAVVNAGEAAAATPNTLPVVAPIRDLAADFAWANGELVLRNTPFGEALVSLSRWYGMEFRVTDTSLLEEMVDGVFPSSFSQGHINVLAKAMKARVTRSANTITFSAVR